MSTDRVDRLVLLCFVTTVAAVVGMLFDFWQLVYYSVPALTVVLMLMGGLSRRDRWSAAVVVRVVAFGGVLLALFVVADIVLRGGARIGGLPASTAVFLYGIWPVTAVCAPLLFAWVYHRWLRHDVEDAALEPDDTGPAASDRR